MDHKTTDLTLGRLRKMTRDMDRMFPPEGRTSPDDSVPAPFVGVVHHRLRLDVQGLPGFIRVVEYGNRDPLLCEFGIVEDVAFVLYPAKFFVSARSVGAYPLTIVSQEDYRDLVTNGPMVQDEFTPAGWNDRPQSPP